MKGPLDPGVAELGIAIRIAREGAGMSQEALAVAAGLDENTIQNVESGRCNPTYSTILKIAAALGVDRQELTRHLSPEERRQPRCPVPRKSLGRSGPRRSHG